jgi:hypothetical protein
MESIVGRGVSHLLPPACAEHQIYYVSMQSGRMSC